MCWTRDGGMATPRVAYFGKLTTVNGAGHHLYLAQRHEIPWSLAELDGRIHVGHQELGFGRLTVRDGWTALACWDRSTDHRLGSHSVFMVEQVLGFDEAVEFAREHFQERWNMMVRQPGWPAHGSVRAA